MGTAENAVTRAVREVFETAGWIVVRTPAGVVKGASGKRVRMAPESWPDLTCFGPGRRVELLEVKTLDGILSHGQAMMIRRLEAMGHYVHVVRGAEGAVAVIRLFR